MGYWEAEGKSDEWYTPKYIFDALEVSMFDMDVASPIDRRYCNVPAKIYVTKNSLDQQWTGFIWMNPPFGKRNGLFSWLEKFARHRNGIALTPDRTSAPWWQWAANNCDGALLIGKKVSFINQQGCVGKSPSTGTTLFGCGHVAMRHLEIASKNNLGKFVKL